MITAESSTSKKSRFPSVPLQICQLLLQEIAAYSNFSQCTLQFVIILAGKQMFLCMQKGLRRSLQSKVLVQYVNYLRYWRELLSLPFWYRTCSSCRCTAEPPLYWAWLHRYKDHSQPVRKMTSVVQDG